MNSPRAFRLTMLIAAFMLALTSFASAARMVPNDANNTQVAAFIAMGGTLDDLCGDDFVAHTADCPFCHITADVRLVRVTGTVWQLMPDAALTAGGRKICDQKHRSARSARGPPVVL